MDQCKVLVKWCQTGFCTTTHFVQYPLYCNVARSIKKLFIPYEDWVIQAQDQLLGGASREGTIEKEQVLQAI